MLGTFGKRDTRVLLNLNGLIKMNKRKVEVCVISDLHLGTFGCQSKQSIHPKTLILNGIRGEIEK